MGNVGDFSKYFTSTVKGKKIHFNVKQRRPPVVDTLVDDLFAKMEKVAKNKNTEVGTMWTWGAVEKFVCFKLESEFVKGKDGELTVTSKDLEGKDVDTILSMETVMADLAAVRVFSTGDEAKAFMASPATASSKGEPLTLRLLLAYIVKTTKKMCENDEKKKAAAFAKSAVNKDLINDDNSNNGKEPPSKGLEVSPLVCNTIIGAVPAVSKHNEGTSPSHNTVSPPNDGKPSVPNIAKETAKKGEKSYPKELYNQPHPVTLALVLETGDEVIGVWTNAEFVDEGEMEDFDSLYGGLAYCSQKGSHAVDLTVKSRDRLQVDIAFQDGDSQVNAKLSEVALKLNETYYDVARVKRKLEMLRDIHIGNEEFTKEVGTAMVGKDLPLLKSLLIKGIQVKPPETATTPTSIRSQRKKRSGPGWNAVKLKSSDTEYKAKKKEPGSKKRARRSDSKVGGGKRKKPVGGRESNPKATKSTRGEHQGKEEEEKKQKEKIEASDTDDYNDDDDDEGCNYRNKTKNKEMESDDDEEEEEGAEEDEEEDDGEDN
jgi:hypothetical protein